MKKRVIVVLLSVCALSLFACGKTEKTGEVIDFENGVISGSADKVDTDDSVADNENDESSQLENIEEAASTMSVQDEIAEVEKKSLEFENAEWDSLPQQDMNYTTSQWYMLWDDELNSLWSRLTAEVDAETKESILVEQREWIKLKEKNVKDAGEEVGGGSLQPQIENTVAKSMTRARVYVLAGYLADARGEAFIISDEVQASLDVENPSVEKTFEHFEGVWPVFDSEDAVIGIQRFEDTEFYATADFKEPVNWVVWYTRGGIMTDADVISHTADSITFKTSYGYYKINENIAGEIELLFGEDEDNLELVFMADASLY